MYNAELQELVDKYLSGSLDLKEAHILHQLLGDPQQEEELKTLMMDHLERIATIDYHYPETGSRIMQAVESRLFGSEVMPGPVPAPVVPFFRRSWIRYAASVMVIVGLGTYFLFRFQPGSGTTPQKELPAAPLARDIAPGKAGAVLTLSDGRQLLLDSLGNGLIAEQSGTTATLREGRLIYSSGKEEKVKPQYNIMSTPRGRQFQLTLPDGTRVWLNAESSIRFPISFSEKERQVEITGEAYFEVTKNAHAPFNVTVPGKAEIVVLGTSFNINAYSNESSLNTTLIDGKVKVNGKVLNPGQQIRTGTGESIVGQADLEKVLAWKNGLFNFNNASLPEVMRQLERWYDIEVVYEKQIPVIEFGGEMSKEMTLVNLLETLKASNVHFRLEDNRRLIVTP
ncbi:MAG: FecR domain-containing protein [Chitinophagaceae bacterium]|nr:FecR domain-containing protein [Chitinophagaceae bacterium]